MPKNKISPALLAAGAATIGLIGGFGAMAGAQTIATTTTAPAVATTAAADSAVETAEPKAHGHAPIGGDGVVASVNGTTIVMGEEADEGGASYTIDASHATVTTNGAAGSVSDIKAGQKIFVQGTTSGTNVTATSISIGHPGGHGNRSANDTDTETADDAAMQGASTAQ